MLRSSEILNNATVTTRNSIGEAVLERKNISGNIVLIDGEKLQSGIYFLEVTQDGRMAARKKLVATGN